MRERRVDYSFRGGCGSQLRLPDQVVFHHIPKTAGSSFNQILRTLYRDDQVCGAVLDQELADVASKGLHRYQLFIGHYSFETVRRYFGAATRMTFLRDPIQRCISQYHNWHDPRRYVKSWVGRSEANSEVAAALRMATQMSLSEFVRSKNLVIADSAQNMLTRYLACAKDWQQEAGYYDAMLVQEAKYNLAHFFHFFGLTEQFERSLLVLAQTLGVRPWGRGDALLTNRNPDKASFESRYNITQEEASTLSDYNRMDIELYEFAVKEFGCRFDAAYRTLMENAFERLAGEYVSDDVGGRDYFTFDIVTGDGARGLHFLEHVALPKQEAVLGRWTGLEPVALWEIPLRAEIGSEIVIEIDLLTSANGVDLMPNNFSLDSTRAIEHEFRRDGEIGQLRLVFRPPGRCDGWVLHTLRLTTALVPAADGTRNVGMFILGLRAYGI